MKTKRLFLKLLLAVCFLMAVPPREAEAADPLYLDRCTTITIDENGATCDNNAPIANTAGFTITGRASNNNIVINVPGTLNLTFDNISGNLNITIESGIVNVAIKDSNRIVSATASPAITINPNAQLHFTSGTSNSVSNISIVGGNNNPAIKGGKFYVKDKNVSVSLYAGTGSVPFDGTQTSPEPTGELTVTQGTLKCYNSSNLEASFGNGTLTQSGGNIIASGLASIDMSNETIKGLVWGNYNYWMDNERFNPQISTSNVIPILNSWHGRQLEIAPDPDKPTGTNSISQTLDIPQRRKQPTGLSAKSEETAGSNGAISGVDETMQYSSDGGQSWQSMKDKVVNKVINLPPGTYLVRNGNTDNEFASKPFDGELKIERGGALEISLPDFSQNSVDYGYTEAPAEKSITIKNKDTTQGASIEIIDIKSESSDFTINGPLGGSSTIASGGTDSSWQIQPKRGLSVGTHTTSITVTYIDTDGETKTAGPTDAGASFTVNKIPYNGDPAVPGKPEVEKVTYNSIKLKPMDPGVEGAQVQYRIVGSGADDWSDPGVTEFKNLESEQKYNFVARYAATDNIEASGSSEPSDDITTEKKASILTKTKQLSVIPGREYQISLEGSPEIYDKCTADKLASDGTKSLLDIKDKWFGNNIVLLDTTNGATQTLTIPDITKAPTTPQGVATSFSGATDGQIVKVTKDMEYRLKDGNDDEWVDCGGTVVKDLPAGTYLVRSKAIEEGTGKKFAFASRAKEVVVPRGKVLSITPTDLFDLGKSPYKTLPNPKAIAIRNHDSVEDVTITSITLSDDSPFTILHKETDSAVVSAGKNNETFKIQPKPDLIVGTYTDEFVVSYIVGYSPDTDTSTGDGQIQAQSEGFNAGDTTGTALEAIPITFTVEKGTQEAPPVPAEKSVKSTSITLETIPNSTVSGAKAQYSKDSGKTWQDSPTFNKLKADTEYYFVSRYAATDNYNESDISAGENAITTAEKDDDDDTDNSNKNVSSNANGSNGTNGTSGTNGTNGTNGTTGTNTTGTNGTNGTNNTNGTTSRGVSAARTGDLNNIQLWVTLMIGSYLSCYLIIRDRIKKARIK